MDWFNQMPGGIGLKLGGTPNECVLCQRMTLHTSIKIFIADKNNSNQLFEFDFAPNAAILYYTFFTIKGGT